MNLKNKVSEIFGMPLNMPLANTMWASEQGDKKKKREAGRVFDEIMTNKFLIKSIYKKQDLM